MGGNFHSCCYCYCWENSYKHRNGSSFCSKTCRRYTEILRPRLEGESAGGGVKWEWTLFQSVVDGDGVGQPSTGWVANGRASGNLRWSVILSLQEAAHVIDRWIRLWARAEENEDHPQEEVVNQLIIFFLYKSREALILCFLLVSPYFETENMDHCGQRGVHWDWAAGNWWGSSSIDKVKKRVECSCHIDKVLQRWKWKVARVQCQKIIAKSVDADGYCIPHLQFFRSIDFGKSSYHVLDDWIQWNQGVFLENEESVIEYSKNRIWRNELHRNGYFVWLNNRPTWKLLCPI